MEWIIAVAAGAGLLFLFILDRLAALQTQVASLQSQNAQLVEENRQLQREIQRSQSSGCGSVLALLCFGLLAILLVYWLSTTL